MKTAAIYYHRYMNQPAVPYPNAASRRQVLHKVVDILLSAACCAGIIAIVIFLLMLG